jgi:hypothetical protein
MREFKGRPAVRPVQLRDGYYIEVCSKGASKGVKIRSDNKEAMNDAAKRYENGNTVIILGEFKDGEKVAN